MKIKEFIKEHKTELIVAGCCILSGAAGVVIGKLTKPILVGANEKEFAECLKSAMKGATVYNVATGEELGKMIGKDSVTNGPTGEQMKLTAGLLFGNRVEA